MLLAAPPDSIQLITQPLSALLEAAATHLPQSFDHNRLVEVGQRLGWAAIVPAANAMVAKRSTKYALCPVR